MTLRRARPYWAGKKGGAVAEYSVIYSLRNVSGWTGDVIQVRRVDDSTDEWFGYTGGVGTEIDTSQISTFLGTSAGRVRQFKNTGSLGASYDLINVVNDGPEIFDGTSFHFINGKVALEFNVGDVALVSSITDENVTDLNSFSSCVLKRQTSVTIEGVWEERDTSNTGRRCILLSDTRTNKLLYAYSPSGVDKFIFCDAQPSTGINTILSVIKEGDDLNGYIDGVLQTSNRSDANTVFPGVQVMSIGRQLASNLYFNGLFSEVIIDKSDPLLTGLNDLITDQKSFYGIS